MENTRNIAVCGLDCAACDHHGSHCDGCHTVKGNVFWAKPSGQPGCPVYLCAAQKGLATCAPCPEKPCGIWQNLREPGVTDAEHAANLRTRLDNLSGL